MGTPPALPTPPAAARPVWIVPVGAAALALLFIVVIAIESRRGGTTAPPVTTTTTTTAPAADIPAGNRGNPFPIGTSGVLGGWRLTVLSSSRAGEAVTASLQLIWDGQDGVPVGDARVLVLRVQDVVGKDHDLGGAACAGSPITDLTTVPPLDSGHTATLSLCWTVTGLARTQVGLVAKVAAAPEVTVFALAA